MEWLLHYGVVRYISTPSQLLGDPAVDKLDNMTDAGSDTDFLQWTLNI